jgi:hypothetical protein
MANGARQPPATDPVRRTSARRYPDDQRCPRQARGFRSQPADGAVAVEARRRVVAAQARGDRSPRGHGPMVPPALAAGLRGLGFRNSGSGQPCAPLTLIVVTRAKPRKHKRRDCCARRALNKSPESAARFSLYRPHTRERFRLARSPRCAYAAAGRRSARRRAMPSIVTGTA